jgi:hypothetical protein
MVNVAMRRRNFEHKFSISILLDYYLRYFQTMQASFPERTTHSDSPHPPQMSAKKHVVVLQDTKLSKSGPGVLMTISKLYYVSSGGRRSFNLFVGCYVHCTVFISIVVVLSSVRVDFNVSVIQLDSTHCRKCLIIPEIGSKQESRKKLAHIAALFQSKEIRHSK